MRISLFDPELRQFQGESYEEIFQLLIQEEMRNIGVEIDGDGNGFDPLNYQAYMERCNARFAQMIEEHGDKFDELDVEMLQPARTDSLEHYIHDMILKGFFTCIIVMAEPPFAPALNITIEASDD